MICAKVNYGLKLDDFRLYILGFDLKETIKVLFVKLEYKENLVINLIFKLSILCLNFLWIARL